MKKALSIVAVLVVVAAFNLLSLFQVASGSQQYRQPATLRAQVFLCGAGWSLSK